MKRILLVALAACFCMAIVAPAALADGCGSYTETYTVFMPHHTETTTTTYGCYQQTTVEYQGCPPAPCPPAPCQPEPCQPCRSDSCCEKKAVEKACRTIQEFSLEALKQLDRELEESGWVRLKTSKLKLLKTGRCIYTITVKNLETDEKISCFMVARTGKSVVRDALCHRCCKKHACSEYSLMFVWNYNTGCNAAYYEPDWYITERDLSDGEAICNFVSLLVDGEVTHW